MAEPSSLHPRFWYMQRRREGEELCLWILGVHYKLRKKKFGHCDFRSSMINYRLDLSYFSHPLSDRQSGRRPWIKINIGWSAINQSFMTITTILRPHHRSYAQLSMEREGKSSTNHSNSTGQGHPRSGKIEKFHYLWPTFE